MSVIDVEFAEVTEGGDLVFNVTLSSALPADVTVKYRLVGDGSADVTTTSDINSFSAPDTFVLTIPANQTTATITYRTRSETTDEFDENLTLVLSDPTNATLAGGELTLTATGVILDNDGGQDRGLFVSDPKILESDSGTKQAVFELRLSEQSAAPITLSYTTADGTAIAGEDYAPVSGSITFAPGQTLRTVAVDVFGDTAIENQEYFSLVVTPTTAIANGVEDSTGIATIIADDGAGSQPVISVDPGWTSEGGDLVFGVTLSRPTLADVTVSYRLVADGSASGADALDINTFNVADTFTLTIPAGETTATIVRTTRSETLDETDENISLQLFDPTNAVLAGGEQTLTTIGMINDDDGGQNRALFVSDPRLIEGDSGTKQAVFELRLSEPAISSITLNYTTVDGTAVAGEDYTARSGTVTFLAGQTLASVAIDVLGDTAVETVEQFSLVLTPNLAIADSLLDSTGIATILADDGLTLQPVVSVQSTAVDESGDLVFLVSLSEPSLADVFLSYRLVADGSAILNVSDINSFSASETFSLRIPAGTTTATIAYPTRSETADESDENITLQLSNPINATLAGGEPTLTAVGVILDNDGTGQDRALFVSDPTLIEGDTGTKQAVFDLRISEPSAQSITLTYTTADGSAVAGEDYVATTGSVTFLPGQTVATVRVDVIGDRIAETQEQFSLVVSPTLGIASGVEDSTGIATILADDAASTLPVISVTSTTTEEGGDLVFNVTLSRASLTDTTVEYRLVGDGTVNIADTSDINSFSADDTFVLDIPAGQTTATITYRTSSDNADETDENVTLQLSNPVNAVLSGGEPTLTATGVIFDNDGTGQNRGLFVSDPRLIEGDSGIKQVVFEIRISEPSATAITLSYVTSDGSATAGSDYVFTSGEVTFLPGQTVAAVSVDVIGDNVFNGGDVGANETFSLIVTPTLAIANGTDDSTGIATILNDDVAILGNNANNTLTGDAGPNIILGLGGNDRLEGLAGDDFLFGGDGNDILVGADGNDALFGGAGADAMFGSNGIDRVLYSNASAGVIADLILSSRNTGEAAGDTYNSIELLFGSDFNDELRGTNGNNVISGENGNDRLYGRGGNDDIFGGDGNASLMAGRAAMICSAATGLTGCFTIPPVRVSWLT